MCLTRLVGRSFFCSFFIERNFSLDSKGHVVVANVSLTHTKNQMNDASKRLHPYILSCTQWTVSFQLGAAAVKKITLRNCYMRKDLYLKTKNITHYVLSSPFRIIAALMAHRCSAKGSISPSPKKKSHNQLALHTRPTYLRSSSVTFIRSLSAMCTIRVWKVSGPPACVLCSSHEFFIRVRDTSTCATFFFFAARTNERFLCRKCIIFHGGTCLCCHRQARGKSSHG